jgi:hypothetical protein
MQKLINTGPLWVERWPIKARLGKISYKHAQGSSNHMKVAHPIDLGHKEVIKWPQQHP